MKLFEHVQEHFFFLAYREHLSLYVISTLLVPLSPAELFVMLTIHLICIGISTIISSITKLNTFKVGWHEFYEFLRFNYKKSKKTVGNIKIYLLLFVFRLRWNFHRSSRNHP